MGAARIYGALGILLLWSAPSHAAWDDKLDARARIALERARSGGILPEARLEQSVALSADQRLDVFIYGSVTRSELEAAGAVVRSDLSGLFTAYVPADAVERVAALPGVAGIRGAAPVELETNTSIPAIGVSSLRGAGPTFSGVNGAGVLVGAVDSGIDFGHGDFKDASNRTRLIRIWDQNDVGVPPVSYLYGVEWTQAQIDAGLCTQVDDIGHGTTIMGIAAGDGSQTGGSVPAYTYAGVAPRADLAMVKTNFTNTGVIDGVKYLFDLAASRGQRAVVNLSVGSQYGSHDGFSEFERGVDAITGPGRVLVKSAGNDRNVARHAEVRAAGSGSSVTLSVTGSSTNRAVQIDGYYRWTENLNVRITTPNGTVVGPIARGSRSAAFPGVATPNGRVFLENGTNRSYNGDYQVYFEINVAAGQNMNGTWTITFIPVTLGVEQGEVDLWRFFSSSGVVANFVTGSQPLEELVSEPGNAENLITAAAWVTKKDWTNCNAQTMSFNAAAPGNLAWFSSPGPTRDGRQKPDITGPGSAIVSATSFDVARACASNSPLMGDGLNHMAYYGTSTAAAHVTGVAALLLQNRGALTPLQVKNYLRGNATHDSFTGPGWNKDWGNGKLRHAPNAAPVDDSGPVAALAIQSIAPNPARGSTRIAYALPRGDQVRVGILDVQGRIVATLFDGFQEAGRYEVTWNGERAGGPAPAGLYFVVVQASGERARQRLVFTR
jgi:subtilisin family serine protease